jgi:thioredoxin 1
MVKEIKTLDEFKKETSYDGLTVIDFYATWCGPCKVIAPIVDQLESQNPSVHFFKVDVDGAPEVAAENGITHMPTILFYKNGEKVETVVGANVNKIREAVSTLQ